MTDWTGSHISAVESMTPNSDISFAKKSGYQHGKLRGALGYNSIDPGPRLWQELITQISSFAVTAQNKTNDYSKLDRGLCIISLHTEH